MKSFHFINLIKIPQVGKGPVGAVSFGRENCVCGFAHSPMLHAIK